MDELKDSLKLPENYSYMFLMKDNYITSFRIKEVKDAAAANDWIKDFSIRSKVTWRCHATYPNAGRRNIFRKDMRCQHNTDSRKRGVSDHQRSTKNTGCPARLEVTIKRFIPNTKSRAPDPWIKEFPTVIKLKHQHNHKIDDTLCLKYRDMSTETKEKLCSLFRQGHGPTSALHCLKSDLKLEYGDEYCKISCDGSFVPTISKVDKLFKKEFKSEDHFIRDDNMLESLQVLLKEYSKSTDGIAAFQQTGNKEHYYLIICTPIMMRAHQKLNEASKLVVLDSSGGMDMQKHNLYIFVSSTEAGSVPLGIIITNFEDENLLAKAFCFFKEKLPEYAFFSEEQPEIFISHNDWKVKKALATAFPKSKRLICEFRLLESVWSWLRDKRHAINRGHRQQLYFLFKDIVYAPDEERAENQFMKLVSFATAKKYENLVAYISWLWEIKDDWLICYRENFPIHRNNTTNFIEVIFRILGFNLTQLVDFLLTRYEAYVRNRLLDFIHGSSSKSLIINMLPHKSDISDFTVCQEFEDGCYVVKKRGTEEHYKVDIVRKFCSCRNLKKFCVHVSAVIISLEDDFFLTSYSGCQETNDMFFIATGIVSPENRLHPLGKSVSASAQCQSFYQLPVITKTESCFDLEYTESNVGFQNTEIKCSEVNMIEICDSITHSELEDFQKLIGRIKSGLISNPTVFVPALRKMLNNTKNNAATETGLVSAMHTFAKFS